MNQIDYPKHHLIIFLKKEEPFEHLGTIHHLIDPFMFKSSPFLYFKSKSSVSTSQMQITHPGKGEKNDKW
jgi:hypothetical protein